MSLLVGLLACSTPEAPDPIAGEVQSAPIAGALVWVPGGTFDMGSPEDEPGRYDDEGPVHRVTVDGRWVMRGEVSQHLYELVMGTNPSGFQGCPTCPVERVDWYETLAFANGLSEMEGLTPAYRIHGVQVAFDPQAEGYRLLTEAEWEYAARGRAAFRYAGSHDPTEVGWVGANSDQQPHPSCLKRPNGHGLCDLTGNVREWVWDRYGPYEATAQDNPTGPYVKGLLGFRGVRGGSWHSTAAEARVAHRFNQQADYRSVSLGFRVARPWRRSR